MPQTFPPRSNPISKISIILVLILIVAITAVLAWYFHTATFTKVGVKVSQPVPFPHIIHITSVGLNCRYCHASVDQSSFADLPPSETCMSCHSQIAKTATSLQVIRDSYSKGTPVQWNRVNFLPDHVYFDQEIHVTKGVGCETCHGRMDKVTTAVRAIYFYMDVCTGCHKNPGPQLRPLANVYDMGYVPKEDQNTLGPKLIQEYNILPPNDLIRCSVCHR